MALNTEPHMVKEIKRHTIYYPKGCSNSNQWNLAKKGKSLGLIRNNNNSKIVMKTTSILLCCSFFLIIHHGLAAIPSMVFIKYRRIVIHFSFTRRTVLSLSLFHYMAMDFIVYCLVAMFIHAAFAASMPILNQNRGVFMTINFLTLSNNKKKQSAWLV